MKKTLITLFLILVGTWSLQAVECGGTYYYFSQSVEHPVGTEHNDPVGAITGALYNCCAGSSITLYDVDTGISETVPVTENGINSSCAPE